MEKIIFTNGTEIEIKEGASLEHIVVAVDGFADLEPVASALLTGGNLDVVQFTTNGSVSGEYKDMLLVSPLFHSVDIVDGKIEAVFAIREKTDIEKRLEETEATLDTMLGTEV